MVNLYNNNNNLTNNFITTVIMNDDDPSPKEVHLHSEALNTTCESRGWNLWEVFSSSCV